MINNFFGMDPVAGRLTHSLPININKAVSIDHFGQWQPQTQKHARPDSSVKPNNIFTNNLYISRPKIFKIDILRIAEDRYVVHQSLKPHVHYLAIITRHWYAPRLFLF